MMNFKSYNINTRGGEAVSFDFPAEEFSVMVLKAGRDNTIIDNAHERVYMVQAETEEEAVNDYVDWLYGMANIWELDNNEPENCYAMTARKVWASKTCNIQEVQNSYDYVVES